MDKQELLRETMMTTLAAGAKVLQEQYQFSDEQSGMWLLATAGLMARYIGTEEAQAEIEAARLELAGDGQG